MAIPLGSVREARSSKRVEGQARKWGRAGPPWPRIRFRFGGRPLESMQTLDDSGRVRGLVLEGLLSALRLGFVGDVAAAFRAGDVERVAAVLRSASEAGVEALPLSHYAVGRGARAGIVLG